MDLSDFAKANKRKASAKQIEFAEVISDELGIALPESDDFGDYSKFISDHIEAYNEAIRFDEEYDEWF